MWNFIESLVCASTKVEESKLWVDYVNSHTFYWNLSFAVDKVLPNLYMQCLLHKSKIIFKCGRVCKWILNISYSNCKFK
jgi:hypothetical protein